MCTASWLVGPDGYEIFFNRDESRLRARADPPHRWSRAERPFLAPRDPEGGGTWIAVNAGGLTVALLNRYREASLRPVPKARRRSRGLLVLDLAAHADLDAVEEELRAQELDRYPAFTVLAATPGDGVRTLTWSGGARRDPALRGPLQARPPLSSSGDDAEAAAAAREALWNEVGPSPSRDEVLALHRSHRPEKGALSPCMHRAVARTVSLTHVVVSADEVAMSYAAGSPCRTPLGEAVTLERS